MHRCPQAFCHDAFVTSLFLRLAGRTLNSIHSSVLSSAGVEHLRCGSSSDIDQESFLHMNSNEHAGESAGALPACDFLWGVAEIGRAIGRNPRQAFHIISKGELKSVKKLGGRWVASRAALLRELGA